MRWTIFALPLLVVGMLTATPAAAQTVTKDWNHTWAFLNIDDQLPPLWSRWENWDPFGEPGQGQSAVVDHACTYDTGWSVSPWLLNVSVHDVSGHDPNPTLTIGQDNLKTQSFVLGEGLAGSKTGHVLQTGGTVEVESIKIDAFNSSLSSQYVLRGTGHIDAVTGEIIAGSRYAAESAGRSLFIQEGGRVDVKTIALGGEGGTRGEFLMSGGVTNCRYLEVGGYGDGYVAVSGGTLDVSSWIDLGDHTPASMTLSGSGKVTGSGTIKVGSGGGRGTFNQYDSTSSVDVNFLSIGRWSEGVYNHHDGDIRAIKMYVGGGDVGAHGDYASFNQYGGTTQIDTALHLGGPSARQARLVWAGGTITAGGITMYANGVLSMRQDFILNELIEPRPGNQYHFGGAVSGLDKGITEITGGATSLATQGSTPIAFNGLTLGGEDGSGTLTNDRRTIEISGHFAVGAGSGSTATQGEYRAHILGTTPGTDYGQVLGSGIPVATTTGSLIISFVNFEPQAGQTFDLMNNFYELDGTFRNVAFEGLEEEIDYHLDYSNGRLRLTVLEDGTEGESRFELARIGEDGRGLAGGGSHKRRGLDARFGSTGGGNLRVKTGLGRAGDFGSLLPPLGPTVPAGTSRFQYWELTYDGTFSNGLELTFNYDPTLLGGIDEMFLGIFHHTGGRWQLLDTLNRDLLANTLTVRTGSLSPFLLGVVPEPSTALLLTTASAFLGMRRQRWRRVDP